MSTKSKFRLKIIIESAAITIGAIITLFISIKIDLLESLNEYFISLEKYEFDELIIVAIYLSISFLILLVFRLIDSVKREKLLDDRNKELLQTLEENYLMIKENNHRIKNHIVMIESFVRLSSAGIEYKNFNQIIDDILSRILTMRNLYDKITYSNSSDNISLKEYLEDLITSIIDIFTFNESIDISMDIDDIKMKNNDASALGIIINEVITNSMKYGLINNKLVLKISIKRENDRIIIIIKDSGSGFPDTINTKDDNSLGMLIIKNVSQQINAKCNFENNNGAQTTIILNAKI